ncbi:MAG: hydroxyacylglutathione hydrolase [SAR86 cluster bacterium]|uniref:Hydroxyacylglutathione hydrolase n=1 Tax=SAR86 cluster bacterium TaxID=2030880 RepID=A0A2A4MVF4_9GAMM|nr:MAG: hydroxyacylglutathione hydrolase [SAR86 cluster bacterium]
MNHIHPIPAFTDNYIWILCEQGSNKACVVDPGDASVVIQYLEARQLQLSTILITHHHPDHTGGVKKLVEQYQPRVIGPGSSNIAGITEIVQEGDEVQLFDESFQVIDIPGHTLDHIAFYCQHPSDAQAPKLFCGDTLFAAGCGRIFEGNPAQMYASLNKLAALSPQALVYCTHEYTLANLKFAEAADPNNISLKTRTLSEQLKRSLNQPTLPSTLELELDTNPFLRCDKKALRDTLTAREADVDNDELAVFTALRAWKDNF